MSTSKIVGVLCTAIIGGVLLSCLLAVFVMLLWNAVVPDVFAVPAINFWQAVGLTLLTKLLVSTEVKLNAK